MANNTPEECKLCLINFDETLRRPGTIPCGHTYCTPCINNVIRSGTLLCPSCPSEHRATNSINFPISYEIKAVVGELNLVNLKLRAAEATGTTTEKRKRHQDQPLGISKKFQSLLEAQKCSVRSHFRDTQLVQFSLHKYQEQLRYWKVQHQQLQDRLVQQNKAALELLDKEDTRVTDRLTIAKGGQEKLKAMLKSLETVNTGQQFVSAIEADGHNLKAKNWNQMCQEQFPDLNTLHNSIQVREVIRKALDTVPTEEGAMAALNLQVEATTILEKVKEIVTRATINMNNLKIEDLLKSQCRKLVQKGKVAAVQEDDNGGLRSSIITTQDGHLCLHSLLPQPPPAHTVTLQINDILAMVDRSSTLVFLDLQWPGSRKGRVHIRLSPDTPLARQFVLLCTGQRGHTYKDTTLFKVGDKGGPWECVRGGDYQYNTGEGGASLLPHLQGDYGEVRGAGTVVSRWPDTHRAAQFGIITKDSNVTWRDVFGQVVSGLDVVRAAVRHSNIREVTVKDCGVVITK